MSLLESETQRRLNELEREMSRRFSEVLSLINATRRDLTYIALAIGTQSDTRES